MFLVQTSDEVFCPTTMVINTLLDSRPFQKSMGHRREVGFLTTV